MISDFIKSALELLKLTPRYLISLIIITGVLLFSTDIFLQKIGVSTFVSEYRQWLGLTFIIAGVLWGVYIVATCWSWISGKLFLRDIKQKIIQKLSTLTEDEKQILRYYFVNNTRANVLNVGDGVVQGLVANHIIYRSASVGSLVEGFAHNITDIAWDYIHSHPDILQGSTNTYRTDKRQRWYL